MSYGIKSIVTQTPWSKCRMNQWTRKTGNPLAVDGGLHSIIKARYNSCFMTGWDVGRAAMLARWGLLSRLDHRRRSGRDFMGTLSTCGGKSA